MKWYKSGERHEAEARDLLQRIQRREVVATANEILSLEIVRGLRNAQLRQPSLGITDAYLAQAFSSLETMFQTATIVECPVSQVKTQTKEIEITLGLFMADALHLASAVHQRAQYFVVDDYHFRTPAVVNFAAGFGVQIVSLPELIIALGPAGSTSPPSP
jgi:predicted nucleic acid-binding protein